MGVYQVGNLTVHLDTLDNPQEGTLDAMGWEYPRNAKVEGLTGLGAAQLAAAVAALVNCPVTPPLVIGAPHPNIPDARLLNFRPRSRSNGVVEVRITYHEPVGSSVAGNVIEVGSTVQQEQTTVDFSGEPIQTSYKGNTRGATVAKLVPCSVFKCTRVEYQSPLAKSQLYVGSVNSGGCDWHPNVMAHCWMCMSILGTSQDRGVSWKVAYEFAYKKPKTDDVTEKLVGGWDELVAHRDPATGEPPPDVTDVYVDPVTKEPAAIQGQEVVQIYDDEDFHFGFVA